MRFLKSKTALISLSVLIIALMGWYVYITMFEPNMGIFGKMRNRDIKIRNDQGEVITLNVEVADDPDEKQAGFQNVPARVLNKKIILFVFGEDRLPFFHMRNVVSALDIAFIKSSGEIIDIQKMVPGSPDTYGPSEPIRYAIEARSGFFVAHNITNDKSELLIDTLRNGMAQRPFPIGVRYQVLGVRY